MEKRLEIDKNLLKSLVTLGSVIEARDQYTGGHVFRVGQYARLIGKSMQLNADALFSLEVGGLVHDIGKIGTPDAVLNKPGKLTDSEYVLMKHHAVLGRQLIENHPLEQLVIDSVSDHHERVDGQGYPVEKEEKSITLHAKIMSVSDAFDAMTSSRPYRQSLGAERALIILKEACGKQFDLGIVQHLDNLYAQNALMDVLGHGGFGRKMLACPVCGPVIAPSSEHRDGDHIMCPACTGDYILHRHGDTYEVEFTHQMLNLYEPKADNDTIDYVVKVSPKQIRIQSETN